MSTATTSLLEREGQNAERVNKKFCYFTNPKCYPLFRGVADATIPVLFSALLSMLVLVLAGGAHICFWQGQKAFLYQFELSIQAEDVYINAVKVCEALSLPNVNASDCHFGLSMKPKPYVLLKQGYWETIKTVWDLLSPKHYYLKGWTHPWETRLGAILVFIFSGVWPHLKLVLLQITWYVPLPPKLRRSLCFWLDMFGKWSILDVLVISLTVALFDLTFTLKMDEVIGNIVYNLPPLLENTVLTTAQHTKDFAASTCVLINDFAPKANVTICENVMEKFVFADIGFDIAFLDNMYGMLSDGGLSGVATISFKAVSQSGVYWFSAGVSLSLLAGVFVDIVDDIMTSRIRKKQRLLAPPKTIVQDATTPPVCTLQSLVCGAVEGVTLLLGILCAIGIFWLPTIERKAKGPLAELVQAITNKTVDRSYSMVQVVDGIVSGGGGNPFLQKDSIVFLFIGPVLLLCTWAVTIVLHRPYCASKLPGAKDSMVVILKIFATATAWEVLLLAELVIMLEMPTLTANLLDSPRQLYWFQTWLTDMTGEGFDYGMMGFNLEIDFTPWWYVVVMLGGIFMQLSTYGFTLMLHRDTHHNKGSGNYKMMSAKV